MQSDTVHTAPPKVQLFTGNVSAEEACFAVCSKPLTILSGDIVWPEMGSDPETKVRSTAPSDGGRCTRFHARGDGGTWAPVASAQRSAARCRTLPHSAALAAALPAARQGERLG